MFASNSLVLTKLPSALLIKIVENGKKIPQRNAINSPNKESGGQTVKHETSGNRKTELSFSIRLHNHVNCE